MAIIQELESYVQSYPAGMETVTDVSLSQNENGRQLRFKIIGVTIPAGSVATISGTKPDGAVYSKAGTIEGSDTVIFDEDVQMTAVFGTWYAKVRIINSGNTIASARVRFIIDKDPVDAGSVPSDSQLDGIIAEMEAYVEETRSVAYGSPLTASTAAAMTDQTKVYVYTGTETGYTAGHWYFWNGTEWHDGGVYNAVAVQTDKTLSVADKAADGKATGEALEHRIPVYSEDEYTSDSTPYLYRTTGGGVAVETRELDEIVGGSVGWNQLIPKTAPTTTASGVTYTNNGDGSWTLTGTPDSNNAFYNLNYSANVNPYVQGHVYMISANSNHASVGLVSCGLFNTTYYVLGASPIIQKSDKHDASGWVRIQVANQSGVNLGTVKMTPQMFDLTLLLGSTIADYIYGLETATAGAGVAKLKEWGFFTEDYYPYDAGSLQSVTGVSAHETVGKNRFSTSYKTASGTYNGVQITVDDDGSVTLNGTSTSAVEFYLHTRTNDPNPLVLPVGSYILTGIPVGYSTYNLRIGYNKGSSGTTIGSDTGYGTTITETEGTNQYGLWIAFNSGATFNNLKIYPMIRLASVSDATFEPYTKHTYPLDDSLTLRGIPKLDSNSKLYYDGDVYKADGTVTRRYGERAYQNGDTSDGSTMITNGTRTVYKLTTPTTEQADPYASVQICADGGTEEYVTTGIVPVGHNTRYPADLAGKLDSIPALPTTAGNYRLKVTVTGGVPSYEWVSA